MDDKRLKPSLWMLIAREFRPLPDVVRRLGKSGTNKTVLLALASYYGKNRRIFPKVEEIAEVVDVGLTAVKAALKDLQKRNVIYVKRGNRHLANEYKIRHPSEWIWDVESRQTSVCGDASESDVESTTSADWYDALGEDLTVGKGVPDGRLTKSGQSVSDHVRAVKRTGDGRQTPTKYGREEITQRSKIKREQEHAKKRRVSKTQPSTPIVRDCYQLPHDWIPSLIHVQFVEKTNKNRPHTQLDLVRSTRNFVDHFAHQKGATTKLTADGWSRRFQRWLEDDLAALSKPDHKAKLASEEEPQRSPLPTPTHTQPHEASEGAW